MKTTKEFTKKELDKLRKLTKEDLIVIIANNRYIIRQYEELLTKGSNDFKKQKL